MSGAAVGEHKGRRRVPLRGLLAAALLALALGLAGCASQPSAEEAAWTLMVFIDGNNNLQLDLITDVLEMELVGSSEDVHIVAELHRTAGYTNADGSWTGSRRYLIERSKEYDTIADILEQRAEDPAGLSITSRSRGRGRPGSAEPATVIDFVDWAASTYPAERYGLIMLNHGGAWAGGFGADESSPNVGSMQLPELDEALAGATEVIGGPFEFIGFDACLMSQLEILQVLSRYGRYAAAAQELEPAYGWYYTPLVAELTARPEMRGDELGEVAVRTFMEFYEEVWPALHDNEPFPGGYDLTAVDLSRIDAVDEAMRHFSSVAAENADDVVVAVGRARNNTLEFGGAAPDVLDRLSSIDLVHFLSLLVAFSTEPEVIAAAEELIDAIDALIVATDQSEGLEQAHGLAAFFPRNSDVAMIEGHLDRYAEEVPDLDAWREFLDSFHRAATVTASELRAEILEVVTAGDVVDVRSPPTLVFETEGEHVARINRTTVWQRGDGTGLMLDERELTARTFDDDAVMLREHDGYELAQSTWEVDMPVLSDGSEDIPVLLQETGDPDRFSVSGTYDFADGVSMESSLIFQDDELVNVWGLNVTELGTQPHQIKPNVGDRFTPTWRYLDEDGFTILEDADATLTFSDEPFTLDVAPALTGTYELRITVEDIAGNRTSDSVELVVDHDGVEPSLRGENDVNLGLSFVRPWTWDRSIDILREDGRFWTTIADPDGAVEVIIPHLYEDDDINRGVDIAVSGLGDLEPFIEDHIEVAGLAIEDAAAARTSLTIGGSDAWRIDYADGAGRGVLLAVYAEENETPYLIDVRIAEDSDDVAAYVDAFIDTLRFIPVVDAGADD